MATVHDINLFFYIKGSKDYPSGHRTDEAFGFESANPTILNNEETGYLSVNAETALFSNSIRDIFVKNKGITEVSNVYSLFSDEGNNITNVKVPNSLTSINSRNDRGNEYISTFLIKKSSKTASNGGDEDNAEYKKIFPNFDLTKLDGTSDNPGIFDYTQTAIENMDYNPRKSIFWQKMFTLIEFLKKEEANIVDNDITGSVPSYYNSNSGEWNSSAEAALQKESSLGQFIGLFISSDNFAIPGDSNNINTIPLNKYRTSIVAGTKTLQNESTNIYKTIDSLWSRLNIRYIPQSARFQRSVHTGRISYLEFNVSFLPYAGATSANAEEWHFTVYFDPDTFIESSASSQFGVWTYNDKDMDDRYPEYKENGFNIYDNDYANMLSDGENRGHFVATDEEIKTQFAKAILDMSQGKDFTNFTEFSTKRVSPEIVESGTNGNKPNYVVKWDSENAVTMQKFYIFYNTNAPTTEQCITAVKDYLLNLHANCNPETYYASSDTKSGVKYIGHSSNYTDLVNWLSNMYPDLFSETVVYIIPPYHQHCTNGVSSNAYKFDPSAYYHSITPDRIYETMRNVEPFKNFKLSENGVITQPTSTNITRTSFSTEIFYIGSVDDTLNDGMAKYGFPWIASMASDTVVNPLTSQTGFADYKQKFFKEDVVPSSPADLLQLVLIYLAGQMFTNSGSNKKDKITSVQGVNITYQQDSYTDPTVESLNVNNVARFTINSVTFVVYAQIGKSFCSQDGSEISR